MIVIKVELWPLGSERLKKTLGTAVIANDGLTSSRDGRFGDYDVWIGKKGEYAPRDLIEGKHVFRRLRVVGFPRKRLLGWDLLFRALAGAVGDRNR